MVTPPGVRTYGMYSGSTKAPHEAGFDAYCVGYGKGGAPTYMWGHSTNYSVYDY